MDYAIRLRKDGDTILATSPDFPELTTFGEDRDDALLHARDALEEAIAARIANREDVPLPSHVGGRRIALPTQVAVKVLLYREMHRKQMRKVDLANALNLAGPQVDRILDIRHSTKQATIDDAFRVMGKKLAVRLEVA